jgi:hypothetical protein
MTIPDLGSDLVSVALRTAIVYVCLVLGFRIFGKREAGQLSTLDLVVLLVIANAVQNAMVGENTSLAAGLLAALVILALDRGLHVLTDRSKIVRATLEGEPVMLVEDGKILEEHLRSEGISSPSRASMCSTSPASRSVRSTASTTRKARTGSSSSTRTSASTVAPASRSAR